MRTDATPDEIKIVSGDGRLQSRIDWELANIKSIQDGIAGARHSTMYYPASGGDSLRCVAAFDLDRLVTADVPEVSITNALDRLGIAYSTRPLGNDAPGQDVTFSFNGRQRVVTEIYMDARLIDLRNVPWIDGKVDIYYVFAPTNADHPLMSETGEMLGQAVTAELTPTNYRMVRAGGLFSFEDRRIDGKTIGHSNRLVPKSMYGLLGLEEIETTGRHPEQIETIRLSDDVPVKPGEGYLYRKTREIDPERIPTIMEGLSRLDDLEYVLYEIFVSGQYSALMDTKAHASNPSGAVKEISGSLNRIVDEYIDGMVADIERSGLADGEQISQIKADTKANIRAWLSGVGRMYKEFVDIYAPATQELREGKIGKDELLQRVGMDERRFGKPYSSRFPFLQNIFTAPKEESQVYLQIAYGLSRLA